MGQSPPSDTYNDDGEGLPFYQGKTDFGSLYPVPRKWCNRPQKVAQLNDILISVRAPVGPTNLCNSDACIGRGIAAIRSIDGISNNKYVLYYLRSIEELIESKGTGSTFQAIGRETLSNIQIPLPPLPIQKKIAAILEKADAAREKRLQANALTEQFLQSAFLDMFGDPVMNPKGWEIVTIDDVTSHVTSGSTPLGGQSTYVNQGILFIRSQNVLMNGVDFSDIAFISKEVHNKMTRTWVKKGDVLFNITGASIGRVSYYKGVDDSANVNQHVCIIRPEKAKINPEFLSFYLSMPRYQIAIMSRNSGATRQAFNFEQIRKFKVNLPPLSLQQKFAALVEKVEAMRAKQRDSEKELENLFQSLMQRAFKGELV